MNAGQETQMMRGAILACILPMVLGLFGLALILQDLSETGRSFSQSDHFLTLPIVLCFIFGTPLAAWLTCLRLRKTLDLSWRSVVGRALHSATRVHFWAAVIYTILTLFFSPDGGTIEGAVIQVIGVLIMSAFINAGLWFFITLPFSFFCATIFWAVTKFLSDRTVF